MSEDSPRPLPAPAGRIRVGVDIAGRSPAEVFSYFTEPRLLARWWVPESHLEAATGGSYEFRWPKQDWTLRGTFVEFEPATRLRFSWRWDHEPEKEFEVIVSFDQIGRHGTAVVVEHGPYGDAARDRELREEHLAGWLHFLGTLAEVAKSAEPR